jgi:hypothetical protein
MATQSAPPTPEQLAQFRPLAVDVFARTIDKLGSDGVDPASEAQRRELHAIKTTLAVRARQLHACPSPGGLERTCMAAHGDVPSQLCL